MNRVEARKRLDAAIGELEAKAMAEIGFTLVISPEERATMVDQCHTEGLDIEDLIVVMRENFDQTIASAKRQGIRRTNH